jgi:integrase/recombinase XerD
VSGPKPGHPAGSERSRTLALLIQLRREGERGGSDEDLRSRRGCSARRSSEAVREGCKNQALPALATNDGRPGSLIAGRPQDSPVFLNRYDAPVTRFGIHTLVERHAKQASERVPSLAKKRVSPHTIRHTTATHLLRAGVDINTIRAWLGHVSVDTTNIYAEVDLEMKAKALAACDTGGKRIEKKMWRANPRVMEFLRSL